MWRSFAMAILLLTASSPALAFPVIFGSISNGFVLIALSAFGIVGSNSNGSLYKKLSVALLAVVAFLAYDLNINKEISNLGQEHEYFAEQVTPEAPLDTFLIPMDEAKRIIKESDLDYLVISESKTPSISGFSLTYFKDEKQLKKYSEAEQGSLFLFSKFRNNGIHAANLIRKHTDKPIYIVDSGFISIPKEDIKFNEVGIFANYKSTSFYFDKYNVITLGDNNALKTYFVHNSKLITVLDALLMSDSDWGKIKGSLDKNKPLLINSSSPLGPNDSKNISGLIAKKLGFKEVNYSYSHDAKLPITLLSNDNQIAPAHFKSTNRLSPTQLYGFEASRGDLTIICFTSNCIQRIPVNSKTVKGLLIKTEEMFSLINGELNIDLDSLSKEENIFIASSDSASSMLSYHLAKKLIDNEYKFQGFTTSVEALFGAVYDISTGNESTNSFYYDSPLIRASTFLNSIYYSITPEHGIKVEKETIIVIGVVAGLLISLGGFYAILASALSFLMIASFNDIFHLEATAYQIITFNPFLLAVLLAIISTRMLVDEYSSISYKYIALYFVVSFAISVPLMHFTYPPMDMFYGGLLVTLASLKLLQISFGKRLRIIGTKYRKTSPFVRGHKGYIATNVTKLHFIKLLVSYKWIIRSNHLSEEEDAGGIFESKVSNIFNVNRTIKELKGNLNGKIDKKNIQFWVMPYVKFKKTGVISSHDYSSPFCFAYSISEPGMVTDGVNSSYKAVHRKEKMSNIESKLLKALHSVEKYHDHAVILEFGLKNGKVHILQVKPLKDAHSSHDKVILKNWREKYHSAARVEDITITPLSRSFVSKLYNYTVLFDESSAYRTTIAKKHFDMADAKAVFNSLQEAHLNLDQLLFHCNLYGLARILSENIAPVTNVICSEAFVNSETELGYLQREIYKYMSDYGIIPKSFEIDEDWYSGDITVNYSERDLSKSLVLLAFGLIKLAFDISKSDLNLRMSLPSIIDGKEEDAPLNHQNDTTKSNWVIVDGKLPKHFVDCDNISDLPEKVWKDTVLIGETIPPAQIGIIRKFGGVVSKQGSPLCHLALSAKFFNIPCRIGPKHYEQVINQTN